MIKAYDYDSIKKTYKTIPSDTPGQGPNLNWKSVRKALKRTVVQQRKEARREELENAHD